MPAGEAVRCYLRLASLDEKIGNSQGSCRSQDAQGSRSARHRLRGFSEDEHADREHEYQSPFDRPYRSGVEQRIHGRSEDEDDLQNHERSRRPPGRPVPREGPQRERAPGEDARGEEKRELPEREHRESRGLGAPIVTAELPDGEVHGEGGAADDHRDDPDQRP